MSRRIEPSSGNAGTRPTEGQAAPEQGMFAVELHSDEPERLVAFYERLLSVTFVATSYPWRRYVADIGQFALIISDARAVGPMATSDHGRVTLTMLSPPDPGVVGREYFLVPMRPLGGRFPARHATRLRDPDGNYVALVPTVANATGNAPRAASWHRALLTRAAAPLGRLGQEGGRRLRHHLHEVTRHGLRVTRPDARGYTHVIASRAGLFVASRSSWKRVLSGRFFGATVKDGAIYCFQARSRSGRTDTGRILRLQLEDGRITGSRVVATGFDDECHQIDFIGETLHVVDCANARILQVQPGRGEWTAHYPLGRLDRQTAMSECHMNSLAGRPDGTMWLLLHNMAKRHSEVLVLDRAFSIVRRFSVDAGSAHNIVFTDDDADYLIADSYGGRLISARGVVIDDTDGLAVVRGISLGHDVCVVGESFFVTREARQTVGGRIHAYDRRTWARLWTLTLPAAPTEIRRLDGCDLSISNYLAAHALSAGAPHLAVASPSLET
jgi:hypothetical protein